MKFYIMRTNDTVMYNTVLEKYPELEKFVVETENNERCKNVIVEIDNLEQIEWILDNVCFEIVIGKTIDGNETIKQHKTIYKKINTIEIYDDYRE